MNDVHEKDIIDLIDEKYLKMSKSHKKIALFIKEHYDQAVFMTAAKIGSVLDISESTVVRFASGLGFEGFPDFQEVLAEWVKNKLNTVSKMGAKYGGSSQSEILIDVLQADMEKIADNIRSQNFGARKIIFFVIDLIIILYSNKLRKAFPDKLFGFSLILFIILYTTQPIFVNSMVFSRIIGYYYISRAIMASYLCFYLTKYRPSFHNYWIAIIIFALFILHILIQIYVDSGGHTDCIRYQFFWEHLITL